MMMSNERLPNDPYQQPLAGSDMRGDEPLYQNEVRDPARLSNKLQVDPALAEGPASGRRMTMFAVAIALVLGAVFYSLNSSSTNPSSSTSSTAQTAAPASSAQSTAQPGPSGMRDVTPRANSEPGMTTGAAPANPQTPPSSAPTGQDATRAGNAPMGNGASTK